ncbi:MAG: ABC transporter ATP-binding protein [Streptosporangiaceae bacterium]
MLSADVEADRREFTVRAELSVPPGERLALFGPSGAGKTTLLEVIAGLVAPSRGRVELHGRVLTSTAPPRRAVPPWQRRVGLLRQDPGLFPHLSVRGNLKYALAAHRSDAELAGLAGTLGIGGLLGAMPARLSGGQAHRVALGRLLLAHCEALLLDEPFTGLDASLRRSLTELVVELVTDRQVPAILVAHELTDAQAFGDRLAILDSGTLLQVGPPDQVVLRPASRRVAELVGYLGFVPVRPRAGAGLPGAAGPAADGAAAAGAAADGAAGPTAAGPAVAAIHPDRVIAGAHPGRGLVLDGMVRARRPSGAGWEADLRLAGAAVTCRLTDRPGAGTLAVTALDPPCFGPDGAALAVPSGAMEPAAPAQARS